MIDLAGAEQNSGETLKKYLNSSLALKQIIVHVTPAEFTKLKGCREHIQRITQLPAIPLPFTNRPTKYEYVQQSLIVTLGPSRNAETKIEIIDATRLKTDAEARKTIANVCIEGGHKADLFTYNSTNKQLFDDGDRWPGLLSATGRNSSAEKMAEECSRETLNEEIAHKVALLESLRTTIARDSINT